MNRIRIFLQGTKHPDTPNTIFRNVWMCDRLRKILKSRCNICNAVISDDEKAVRELTYKCNNPLCECQRSIYVGQAHRVCDLCYDMWHALYGNHGLKNMNYFKAIDEKEARENGPESRKRMGLD